MPTRTSRKRARKPVLFGSDSFEQHCRETDDKVRLLLVYICVVLYRLRLWYKIWACLALFGRVAFERVRSSAKNS